MTTVLILYSGGLDSYIMKMFAEKNFPDVEVKGVYFDIGHDYAYKEKAVLPPWVDVKNVQWLTTDTELHGRTGIVNSGNFIIPGRNLVLAVLGACQYLPDEIWMGALLGETHEKSTDKNYTFLEKTNDTLKYVLKPYKENVVVRFPLADAGFGKLEAVEWALNNGASFEELSATSSCLEGEAGNCGKCIVCLRRWGIFTQLGYEEKYNTHPLTSDVGRSVVLEMLKGEGGAPCHYDAMRRAEIMPAVYKVSDTHCPNMIARMLQ